MNIPETWKMKRLDQILPMEMLEEMLDISTAPELKALTEKYSKEISARGNDPGFIYYRLLYDMSEGPDFQKVSVTNIGRL